MFGFKALKRISDDERVARSWRGCWIHRREERRSHVCDDTVRITHISSSIRLTTQRQALGAGDGGRALCSERLSSYAHFIIDIESKTA